VDVLEGRRTPAVVSLAPVADNTLYQASSADPAQQLSNGAGQHFYVGKTFSASNSLRRGAIRFDLSAVPAGSTVTDVTLTLAMTRTRGGSADVALHRALMSWGEGTSNAAAGGIGPGEGDGVAGGDYTLSLHRLYGDVTGDRFVNGADFAFFRTAFGSSSADPGYNAAFDVNGDGFVNGLDFAVFRTNFGKGI
jgi:hypothetical protein